MPNGSITLSDGIPKFINLQRPVVCGYCRTGMNDSEKRELDELKQRQQSLESQLAVLAADIQRLEAHWSPVGDIVSEVAEGVLEQTKAIETAELLPEPTLGPQPPPLPASVQGISQSTASSQVQPEPASSISEFVPGFVRRRSRPPQPENKLVSPVPPLVPRTPVPPEPKASFEMRLGTYWLVRIGAVLILTGLVFFGNLAYQKMGALGKVSLLYLASGLLLGAGAWWQRKSVKESLHNYAQVLFAGGLAAVYFTTYAAYHLPSLRVISSAFLDGVLLFGWAAFMAWIADRRKSELLALFATGLAYYTSVITPVTGFTLYSNLVLAVATVFFLVRNRWAGLSWASLVATYASYAWWRFYHQGEGLRWARPEEGLWLGASFLFCYWLIFTVAVFLSKHKHIAGERRAAFLTFNNGALFTLFVLTMIQVNVGKFWQFSLGYGAVLLVMAELARRFLAAEPITKNTYLTQGLVLVTVGFVSKYTGLQLALVLAAESVMLFILGTLRRNVFLQTGAYLSGAMAMAWGIDGLKRDDSDGLWLGVTLGVLMALNAFWSHWKMLWADKRELRPVPTYFTFLALVMWIATTWCNTTAANFPLALGAETIVLTAIIYVLRVREFAFLGQGLLILGQLAWLARFADAATLPPWWNPLVLIGFTLALAHWWQRQKVVPVQAAASLILQTVYAVGVVALVLVWLEPRNSPAAWLLTTSLLALGVTAYGVTMRAWPLAACAQLFLLVSCGAFALRLVSGKVEWYFPLAPVAALSALSYATWQWFKQKPGSNQSVRSTLLRLAMVYRWVAIGMAMCWVNQYINERERVWVFALIGLGAFLFAGWRRNREAVVCSAAFAATGLATLWLVLPRADWVYFPTLLAVLVLLAQQQLARKFVERYELPVGAQSAIIVVGGLTLWRLLSEWVLLGPGGFYLTASWSGLAFLLFGGGVMLREKMYRWVGLGILASALGRVIIFDVWRLDQFYRVLSFVALGIVLVVLGFIYNKYQDKLRQWL
jgi:uncharacterized membrane protein